MAQQLIIGVDVGTTSIKAGLFDLAGNELRSYSAPFPTNRAGNGYVEQDPDVWVHHIQRAISMFDAAYDFDDLCAIGITSQVNTHVFVDASENALAPAIVWQDGRCGPEAAELDAQVSEADKLRWWGAPMPIDASNCLARMKWMAANRPDIWDKTRHVMLPKDYCILKLTGEVVSDAMSSIGLIDASLSFIPELVALVPGALERLPRLAGMTDIAGTVRSGQPGAGTPVSVGTMDAWASMFGVGVQEPGQGFYLSGTSEVLGVISDTIVATPGILVFPRLGDLTLHAGPTQSGGASVLWYCGLFDMTPTEMAALVETMDFDEKCPIFLPHLQGERAPLWNINSRGTLLGMDSRTGKGEIARAVYEGVGFSARLLTDALGQSTGGAIEALNCGGGGFQSDIWNQIRSDILGCRLQRAAVKNPGLLGAAGMAAVAVGILPDLNAAVSELVKFDRTYEPNPKHRTRYDEKFQLYMQTYEATREVNSKLANR